MLPGARSSDDKDDVEDGYCGAEDNRNLRDRSTDVLDLAHHRDWRIPTLNIASEAEFDIIGHLASKGIFTDKDGKAIDFVHPMTAWLPLFRKNLPGKCPSTQGLWNGF